MQAEGLLPGRRRQFLVVGVIDDQGGIDVDVQPLARGRRRSCRPGRRSGDTAGGTDPGQVRSVDPLVDQPPHRGRRGFRPEHVLTIPAQLPHTVDAVRAVGHRGRQIGEDIPGRVYPRALVGIR